VERAAEALSLDEPIDVHHQHELATGDATHSPLEFQSDAIERICANPLRDEPHPAVVRAVRRFGIVGLVACALTAAVARGWKSPKP
jgi:hypothetical protein